MVFSCLVKNIRNLVKTKNKVYTSFPNLVLIAKSYILHNGCNVMAKSIKCTIGSDCNWSARARNQDYLLKKVHQHMLEHGFTEIPLEIIAKIESAA